MKDQTEVCLLSHGVLFLDEGDPYPIYYRWAFAFPSSLTRHCRRALRHAFPGGKHGLTKFRLSNRMVRLSIHRWCYLPMSRDT